MNTQPNPKPLTEQIAEELVRVSEKRVRMRLAFWRLADDEQQIGFMSAAIAQGIQACGSNDVMVQTDALIELRGFRE